MNAIPLLQRSNQRHAIGLLHRPVQPAIPSQRACGFKASDAGFAKAVLHSKCETALVFAAGEKTGLWAALALLRR